MVCPPDSAAPLGVRCCARGQAPALYAGASGTC